MTRTFWLGLLVVASELKWLLIWMIRQFELWQAARVLLKYKREAAMALGRKHQNLAAQQAAFHAENLALFRKQLVASRAQYVERRAQRWQLTNQENGV